MGLRIEWILRCKAMELESLECVVSRLESVVAVRPTYVLFLFETQSPRGYLIKYARFIRSRSSVEWGELLKRIRLEVLNLLL